MTLSRLIGFGLAAAACSTSLAADLPVRRSTKPVIIEIPAARLPAPATTATPLPSDRVEMHHSTEDATTRTFDLGTTPRPLGENWIAPLNPGGSGRPTGGPPLTAPSVSVVPLPAPIALAGLGLLGVLIGRKRLGRNTG